MKTVLRKQHKAKKRHNRIINTGMQQSIEYLQRHFSATPWWWRATVRSVARSGRKEDSGVEMQDLNINQHRYFFSPPPDPIEFEWIEEQKMGKKYKR